MKTALRKEEIDNLIIDWYHLANGADFDRSDQLFRFTAT